MVDMLVEALMEAVDSMEDSMITITVFFIQAFMEIPDIEVLIIEGVVFTAPEYAFRFGYRDIGSTITMVTESNG
jgi:hypothetical protein